MGETTGIAWTDHTFNPWWGCTKVSPGCDHCYAETFDRRVGGAHWGKGAERRVFGQKHWNDPLRWNAIAEKEGRRARVFCASMADVFDAEAPEGQLERLWALIRETPFLDWQLLTKRPARIARALPADWGKGYPNVWLGTTVENQEQAEIRVPVLLQVPAVVRFLSCEPLIGPLNLRDWLSLPLGEGKVWAECLCAEIDPKDLPCVVCEARSGVDWVIAGGESGSGARPCAMEWIRSLRDQCASAGVAFFAKQLGAVPTVGYYDDGFREHFEAGGFEWPDPIGWDERDGQPTHDARVDIGGRDRKGGDWSEWPADLRVRQFPEARR